MQTQHNSPKQTQATRKAKAKAKDDFSVLNPDAAGIDIGSKEHYVAVPEGRAESAVRSFGCLTPQLHEMAHWSKQCHIKTIAMESTGVFWVPVVQVLEQY